MCRGSSQSSAWTIGTSSSVPKVKSDSFLDLFTAAVRTVYFLVNLNCEVFWICPSVCLSQLGNEASSVWNFCTRFSFFDLISSLGNQWCRREMAVFWRLVFTSDRVVVGVVRALMTQWNSNIGVVRGVLNATESESEESDRFHLCDTVYDSVAWVPLI